MKSGQASSPETVRSCLPTENCVLIDCQQNDCVLRNREHQRQSRARRREYISELESRIRKYEDEGSRITAEVQAAARKVAEENRNLRALLKAHGISTAVIDTYLSSTHQTLADAPSPSRHNIPVNIIRSMRSQSNGLAAQRTFRPFSRLVSSTETKASSRGTYNLPNTTTVLEAGGPNTESDLKSAPHAHQSISQPDHLPQSSANQARLIGIHILASGQNPRLNNDSPEQELVYLSTPNSRSHSTGDDARMLSDDESTFPQGYLGGGGLATPPLSSCSPGKYSGRNGISSRADRDETDCEHAARIIASMRGHEDTESLWPELGCSTERNCSIKNVRIFQMA